MNKYLNVTFFSILIGLLAGGPKNLQSADSFLEPKPGAVLLVEDSVAVEWTAENFQEAVIEYSTDSGATWEVVLDSGVTPQAALWGNYKWPVPNVLPTSHGSKIRVREKNGTGVVESGIFTVTGLNLTNPLGGETFNPGDTINIQWTTKKYFDMILEFSANGGKNWGFIVTQGVFPSDDKWGNFPWVVPDTTCDQCQIVLHQYFSPPESFKTGKFTIEKSSSAARFPFQVKYEKSGVSAFPNPFRGEVQFFGKVLGRIDFNPAGIQIIDIRGKEVVRLNGKNPTWDGRNILGKKMAAGRYFYRVQAPLGKSFSGAITKN